jgi:hypothetical protein
MRVYRRVAVLNTLSGSRHIAVSLAYVSILGDEVKPEEGAAVPQPTEKRTHLGAVCRKHPEANGLRCRANRYRQSVCVKCWAEEVGQRRRLNGASHAHKMRTAAG